MRSVGRGRATPEDTLSVSSRRPEGTLEAHAENPP